MNKNNMKKGIFTALLLASPFVTAGTQYPAADFQPKVVYQDKDYQHQDSSSASSSSKASFGEKSRPDANYPAANFKPEVLFSDAGYQHKVDNVTSKAVPLKKWEEPTEKAAGVVAEQSIAEVSSDGDSGMSPLIAIVIFACAGFLFLKKSSGSTSSVSTNPTGPTGVAKYLQNKEPKLSGVAKYLEANQPAPKSGVAKYVARKVVEAKKTASEKTTSVEKYVRNRG